MAYGNRRLNEFVDGLEALIKDNNGEITDKMITRNFCVIRIRLDQNLLDKITRMREIARADRPPIFSVKERLKVDIQKIDISGAPAKGKPGILVVDSGIRNHPLLQDSIADSIVLPKNKGSTIDDIDDVGHGTQVAGIALYGDISRRIDASSFDPQLWLYSAKVMYDDGTGYATFDIDELLEHQFKDAVERTIRKHDNCRVINVSLGNSDNRMYEKQRQFRLASLIDELSFQYKDILFTVAAGNNDNDVFDTEEYPKYLLEESPRVKIIDPATSAHALTVGSTFEFSPPGKIQLTSPAPFTRVGPGLNGMIKPDLVTNGGGFSSDLLTINPRWVHEGRLFTLDRGTSFSSPMVAHYLAVLKGAFPLESRNMIKALILSSATIPSQKPLDLNKIAWGRKGSETQKVLNLYGYGVPNLNDALHSSNNRVLLRHEGKIKLDRVHFFAIMMPTEFLNIGGHRSIEIVLVYDPPTNRNRADYLGVVMNFRLYKNISPEAVQIAYTERNKDDSIPDRLKSKKINMTPSFTYLNKGVHQKAIKEWSRQPKFKTSKPLMLAVTCQKRWYEEKEYEQPYAIVVTVKHEKANGLYDLIRVRNPVRAHVQTRV